jgi:hypothetical protein
MLLRSLLIAGLLMALTGGCTSAPKDVRPHLKGLSGTHLVAGSLGYVFAGPPSRIYEAVESVLKEQGFELAYARRVETPDRDQFNRYGEIGTQFANYKHDGKDYRKKCEATVSEIRSHPGYAEASMRCVLEVYELGLIHGRGGIHNLFTQWWDWYPENGLYVAEDMLELVGKRLKLGDSQIIRLNQKDAYSRQDILKAIEQHKR